MSVPVVVAPRSPSFGRRHVIAGVACLAIAAGVALAARAIDWSALGGAMVHVHWPLAALALTSHAVALALASLSWWVGLRAAGMRVPLADVTACHWLGQAACSLLPARLGEAARVLLMRPHVKDMGRPGCRVAGSLLAQRALNAVASFVWILGVASLVALPAPFDFIRPFALAVVLGGPVVVVLAWRLGAGRRLRGVLARRGWLDALADGAGVLGCRRAAATVLGLQTGLIMFELTAVALALAAFGLPVGAVLVVFTLRCMAAIVPAAPGGIGVTQAAIVAPLGISYGVAVAPALAFALGLQFMSLAVALAGVPPALAYQRRRRG